jgi:tetraacyldisaccharide 4'-kinase
LAELQSEVFILDDGFQHLSLARDLDIVTLDASAPWGGGHLLPRGRLREPLDGLARAHCIVITRAELVPDLNALRAKAAQLSAGRPVFTARTRTTRVRPLAPPDAPAPAHFDATKQPFAAFCAIGNPQAFFQHARAAGCDLRHTRAFNDHHNYTQADIDELTRAARQSGAHAFITTAKDAVKLRALDFALPCFVLEIELVFDEEEELLSLVRAAIAPPRLS